jgi:hypothetical protein
MYSAADYLEMIIIFGECERNAREAARVFEERFPGRNDNYFFSLPVRNVGCGYLI